MAKHKTAINLHAKAYIAAVFEETLRKEGFACPDDKLLCWYRIRGEALFDTVVFCSNHVELPLMMDVIYETIPLFCQPRYIQNVNYNTDAHDRTDCMERIAITEEIGGTSVTMAPYGGGVEVYAPMGGGRGLYTLTEILLPYFRSIDSVRDCYLAHKNVHLESQSREVPAPAPLPEPDGPVMKLMAARLRAMGEDISTPEQAYERLLSAVKKKEARGRYPYHRASPDFIDEVIWANDPEPIPNCRQRTKDAIEMYEELLQKKPGKKAQSALQHWELLRDALGDSGREAYCGMLQQRAEKNLARLKSTLNIGV